MNKEKDFFLEGLIPTPLAGRPLQFSSELCLRRLQVQECVREAIHGENADGDLLHVPQLGLK